jgi:hypothetical protein
MCRAWEYGCSSGAERTVGGRFALLLCTIVCWLGVQTSPARAAEPPQKEPAQATKVWKVLMIGNSYTYFNNLPKVFEQLALADKPPRQVRCEMIVEGGATLQRHWDEGKALKAIERGGWDFVVLQEQSTLGVTYLVQGRPRITESRKYVTYARRFDEAIRKAGGRTVVFAFWARENAPAEDQNALAYYHFQLGKDLGALVAPVGLAWQAVRKHDADIPLYHDDHSHPKPEGTYLAACVLYAACFGKAPADPPLRVTGKPIDVEAREDAKREATLVKVSPERARLFRDAANTALESAREFARELEKHKPAPPRLPQMTKGRRPTREELQGEWTGETRLYPTGSDRPGKLHLRLKRAGDSWEAEASISFGGRPPDIVLKITDFQVTDEGISFVDANKEPNGGGVAHYRGAYTGKSLRGIAEINLKDAPLHVIGSWELTKMK